MDIIVPADKLRIGGYCQKCGNDGYYFADAVEECHFVECAQCGQQALETWCPACGVGFTKVLKGRSHPFQWECEECKRKYTLPSDFYNQPVLLHREVDIPKHLRKSLLVKLWEALWPMLKPTTIRVKITLVIGTILWVANALVWNKTLDMYHQVLRRDLFFAAMLIVMALPFAVASDSDWNLTKRFDRWASRVCRSMWAVVMVVITSMGTTTGYDWFASPRYVIGQVVSVRGQLEYTTSHEGYTRKQHPSHFRFAIKLDKDNHTWRVDSPFSKEDYYRGLLGKEVVIEYTSAGKKVVSIKPADVGIR